MNHQNIKPEDLDTIFLKSTPLIDVRAPIEFALGCLPNAVNLPLLNDSERALVGTTYKQKGREDALRVGYEIVSGSVKSERLKAWSDHIKKNPEAIIYCFRGGLRSQITQEWLKDQNIDRPIIIGGYKQGRQHLIDRTHQIIKKSHLILISGPTGSGKTNLLNSPVGKSLSIDLEDLARHRGSAFGARSSSQPTQINFENALALNLIRQETKRCILLEDESRLIGRNFIPSVVFDRMRESSVIWIEEELSQRVQNIFADYILNSDQDKLSLFNGFKKSVTVIQKKLGGLRAQEITSLIEASQSEYILNGGLELNKQWIEKLLVYYYDPLYLGSIERRKVKIAFKGSLNECRNFISALV